MGWTPGAVGDCYRIVPPSNPDGAEREEARALCAAAGEAVGGTARLASPENTPDIAQLETMGGGAFDIWTSGIYDKDQPYEFVWQDSPDAFSFAPGLDPWGPNQPDGMPGESCVMIEGGKLHTYECDDVDWTQPFAAGCELVP
jgi:hypothetical protein